MPYKRKKNEVGSVPYIYDCKYCKEKHIFDPSISNLFLSSLNELKSDLSKANHANSCPNFHKV